MNLLICSFLFAIGASVCSSQHPNDISVGDGACKPIAPALHSINFEEFAKGLWYIDSSTAEIYTQSTCLAFKFHWHAHKFHYNHRSYLGHMTYTLRLDNEPGRDCFHYCSFARDGHMHGFGEPVDESQCKFGVNSTTNAQVHNNKDPCLPHYALHWDLWIMKTITGTVENKQDARRRYALVWLCSGTEPFALLLSREENVNIEIRNDAELFLLRHSYFKPLLVTHNKCHVA